MVYLLVVVKQEGGDYIPVSDYKETTAWTLADNINEVILGFDGTPATSDDGSAGRPAITLVPSVTIVDETSLLVEATLPYTESFTDKIRGVCTVS